MESNFYIIEGLESNCQIVGGWKAIFRWQRLGKKFLDCKGLENKYFIVGAWKAIFRLYGLAKQILDCIGQVAKFQISLKGAWKAFYTVGA